VSYLLRVFVELYFQLHFCFIESKCTCKDEWRRFVTLLNLSNLTSWVWLISLIYNHAVKHLSIIYQIMLRDRKQFTEIFELDNVAGALF